MFYDRFIQLCNDANVTPAYVADTLGLNKSTVYMWKKQGTSPRYETANKLATYFGVDINWLMHGKTLEQRDQETKDEVSEKFNKMQQLKKIMQIYNGLNLDGKLEAGTFLINSIDPKHIDFVIDYLTKLAGTPQFQIMKSNGKEGDD